jgi:hypothetical protein
VPKPIVFVSRLEVRTGRLEDVKNFVPQVVEQIKADKPQTAGFLAYLSDDGSLLTVIHVFADSAAMDLHFAGADQRSQASYELTRQLGWEIYGEPSDQAIATLAAAATETGATLTIFPTLLGGYVR